MTRVRVFVLVALACLVASGAAIASAVIGARPAKTSEGVRGALAAARAEDRPAVVFRSLAKSTRDQIGIAPADAADGVAQLSALRCERVHFDAGAGLCVARGGGFAAGYRARIFGPDFGTVHDCPGRLPSRARVSPDGRYGAATVFVTGDSYARRHASPPAPRSST